MGSLASKLAAEKVPEKSADPLDESFVPEESADPLDESFVPLLGILDGMKVDGTDILNAADYAGLPAMVHPFFTAMHRLVEVDVKSLPEKERGKYRVLLAGYVTALRKLSQFLDSQIVVFCEIVAETKEPAYNMINVLSYHDLTRELHKATAAVACALAVPASFWLRVNLIEAKGLKVIEGNLKAIREHLEAIQHSMSNTIASYYRDEFMGIEHNLLGAVHCLDELVTLHYIQNGTLRGTTKLTMQRGCRGKRHPRL